MALLLIVANCNLRRNKFASINFLTRLSAWIGSESQSVVATMSKTLPGNTKRVNDFQAVSA